MKWKRAFIGTFPCFLCAKKVRVYDWLAKCVLCVRCNREADEIEATMQEPGRLAEGETT